MSNIKLLSNKLLILFICSFNMLDAHIDAVPLSKVDQELMQKIEAIKGSIVKQKHIKSKSKDDVSNNVSVVTDEVCLEDDLIIEDEPVVQERKISLAGPCNTFYLASEDKPKRFAIIGSIYNTFCLDHAFNNCKQSVPMAQVVFGAPAFTIGDVFLLSRLSQTGHLYLTDPADVANQYLANLASTNVVFDADASELGADISFVYRFNFGKCIDVACSVGVNIPVICRTHELDLRLTGSNLDSPAGTVIGSFFDQFNSVEDFFYRGVLAPKGLNLERKQDAFGFGDVSLFSTFDFAPSLDWVDGLQVGFNLSFPTAAKPSGNKIWEPQLGTGAVQLDLFSNVIFNGGSNYFNPTIYIAGEFSFAYTANMRIPQIVSHVSSSLPAQDSDRVTSGTPPDLVPNIAGLVVPGAPPQPGVPPVFTDYFTTTFNEVNSKVRFFADSVRETRYKYGSRVIVGFGNYFYATNDCKMRLGAFYDFTAKGADNICVFACNDVTQFDLSLFNCMSEYAQRISWHAAYKLGCCGEFMIGSQHVVAGRNVFKTNQAFATFVATF